MSEIKLPIYLDYSATTPIDERVAKKMAEYLTIDDQFGNPASRSHAFGWKAEEAVDLARRQVAELVNADPREIIWTSGATESDNLAIKGAAHFYKKKGNHIITLKTEHKAVLDTCRQLEREGFEVTYLDVLPSGLVDLEVFEAAIRPVTKFTSSESVVARSRSQASIPASSMPTASRPATTATIAAWVRKRAPTVEHLNMKTEPSVSKF